MSGSGSQGCLTSVGVVQCCCLRTVHCPIVLPAHEHSMAHCPCLQIIIIVVFVVKK